jgi:hypothetical protein
LGRSPHVSELCMRQGMCVTPPTVVVLVSPRTFGLLVRQQLLPWTELSCSSLRTISERAAQQHHHGLPGASSQAPCNVIMAQSVLFYFHNVNPTEIYTRLHGWPASSQPAAGQTAQLTGLCVQFSSITAGLCAVLSPDSESWANFGSRTVLAGLTAPKLRLYCPGCAVWGHSSISVNRRRPIDWESASAGCKMPGCCMPA